MARADLSSPRRLRLAVIIAVVMLHVAAIIGLIHAFAPDFTNAVVKSVSTVLTVTVETTPEPKTDTQPANAAPEPEGAAAEAGKKAKPKETAAPKPEIVVSKKPAPPVASTGNEYSSGAADAGQGTGAGGEGEGTGSGRSGSGQGGGGGTKAVKIAGDINSAKDYPRKSRDLRIGSSVTIVLIVGTDGRVKGCRIHRASPDPEADRITCQLATERFRFEPATNAAGEPVQSTFGWQQRWFYPAGN